MYVEMKQPYFQIPKKLTKSTTFVDMKTRNFATWLERKVANKKPSFVCSASARSLLDSFFQLLSFCFFFEFCQIAYEYLFFLALRLKPFFQLSLLLLFSLFCNWAASVSILKPKIKNFPFLFFSRTTESQMYFFLEKNFFFFCPVDILDPLALQSLVFLFFCPKGPFQNSKEIIIKGISIVAVLRWSSIMWTF